MAEQDSPLFKSPEEAAFHGLRNAMHILSAGLDSLIRDHHVTGDAGLQILAEMKVGEARAHRCLEAVWNLMRPPG